MPGPTNMVREGRVYAVPEDQVAAAVAQGYRPESGTEQSDRIVGEVKEADKSFADVAAAANLGLVRGASLGLSDFLFSGEGTRELKEDHQAVSIGAEVLGGLSGVGPAGALSKAATSVAAKGTGAVGRAVYGTAGGAIEGAGQAGGAYLSQVALEDKPLSAEGFVGAMGKGALFGGALGGGLSVAETTLMRAKALFPRHEVTKEAAEAIEQQAQSTLRTATDEARAMQQAARAKLDELRVAEVEARVAGQRQVLDLKAQQEALKVERQQVLTDRAKNPPKRTRKAFDDAPAGEAPPVAVAPDAPVPAAGDDLMAQLQGTKSALDNGTALRDIPQAPEVAKLADAVAANERALGDYETWLAKYGGRKSEVAKFERTQATRDYAAGMRSKGDGWVETVPKGEGNVIVRRGRQMEWRGSEQGREAAEAAIIAKLAPEERAAADIAAGGLWGGRKTTGADILDSAPITAGPAATVDDHIATALKPHVGEHVDLAPDLAEAAQVIGKVEQTSADLADALGTAAPAAAAERAAAYRAATAARAEATAASSAQAADDIATKLVPEVARKTGKAVDSGMLDKLGDLGAGLEVLKAIGINVPDIERVPVIGPILSMYLKARAALGVVRRSGGSVARTSEGVIASKSAATRNRLNESIAGMLNVGAKAVGGVRTKAGGVAGILSAQLFPTGEKPKKSDSPRELYAQRMDELARAAQPGAIRQAVRDRVKTSDPMLQEEIAAVMERKLGFLNTKAPRPMRLPTLLKGDGDWSPSRVQLATFARYVEAAEDPAGVLEDVARGNAVTIEAAETLRSVYPALFGEAQRMLLERAQTLQETLPYTRRVTLSVLFQVPVDGTMSPDHLRFLQSATQPAAAPMPAQGSPAPGAPPTPTISGQVAIGDRTMTSLDRRAGA